MIPRESNDSHMNVLVTRFKWPTPAFVTPCCHNKIFLGKNPSLFINDQKNLWIREINKMTKWIIKKKALHEKARKFLQWKGGFKWKHCLKNNLTTTELFKNGKKHHKADWSFVVVVFWLVFCCPFVWGNLIYQIKEMTLQREKKYIVILFYKVDDTYLSSFKWQFQPIRQSTK